MPPSSPEAATESKRENLKTSSPSSIWTAPKKGRLKLNFNGLCKYKSKRSSIGGVYRDHSGKFILGYAKGIGKATSYMAELVALKHGLDLAVANGWRDISIEGDLKGVIDAIAGRVPFRTEEDMEKYMEIAVMLP
jgi:ribonuclease HI